MPSSLMAAPLNTRLTMYVYDNPARFLPPGYFQFGVGTSGAPAHNVEDVILFLIIIYDSQTYLHKGHRT